MLFRGSIRKKRGRGEEREREEVRERDIERGNEKERSEGFTSLIFPFG